MIDRLLGRTKRLGMLHLAVLASLVLCLTVPADAFGQSKRSGSSQRSKPSSASRPSSGGWGAKKPSRKETAAPAPSKKEAAVPARPTSRSKSSSDSSSASSPAPVSPPRSTQSKPPANRAEKALAEKSRKQEATYKDRASATAAFKAKQGESLRREYPSKFTAEPVSRPPHIPESFTPAGKSAPVPLTYRSETGGYSWFDSAVGAYILYDILDDDKIVTEKASKAGFAPGAPVVAQTSSSSSDGSSIMKWLLVLMAILVLIGLAIWILNAMANRSRRKNRPIAGMSRAAFDKMDLNAALAVDRIKPISNYESAVLSRKQSAPKVNVLVNPQDHTSSQGEGDDGRKMKPTDPEYWRDLRPRSIVTLTDKSAIQESLNEGRGAAGEEYTVDWTYQIDEISKRAEWIFAQMTSAQGEIVYLMAMIVDGELGLYIYYPAGGFEPCNREEASDGATWLFAELEDLDNIVLSKLEYADSFPYNVTDEDGKETEVMYEQKSFGVMQAVGSRNPPEGRMLVTVAMYGANADCHSPEAIILEIGSPDNENGGLIGLYLGETINAHEIQVLHA